MPALHYSASDPLLSAQVKMSHSSRNHSSSHLAPPYELRRTPSDDHRDQHPSVARMTGRAARAGVHGTVRGIEASAAGVKAGVRAVPAGTVAIWHGILNSPEKLALASRYTWVGITGLRAGVRRVNPLPPSHLLGRTARTVESWVNDLGDHDVKPYANLNKYLTRAGLPWKLEFLLRHSRAHDQARASRTDITVVRTWRGGQEELRRQMRRGESSVHLV